MDIKYYLVTLCSVDPLGMPIFTNHLVVGFDPVEWFSLFDRTLGHHTLISSWEVSETIFEGFPHDAQNAAWATYHANTNE